GLVVALLALGVASKHTMGGSIPAVTISIVGNPVTLPAGEYTIGAYYGIADGNDDDYRVAVADDLATIPELKFGSSLFIAGNGLMHPTTGSGLEGYFGPNFTVVPEPASLTMTTTAALGLMGYLWLRRNLGLFVAGRPLGARPGTAVPASG